MVSFRPLERLLAGLLTTLPIIIFWLIWSHYAVNVPKWDDHALKYFLSQLGKADNFFEKVLLFFSQHNEHRIVYDRFITWLDFSLFGKLNYRHLMVIGNLSLIGLVFLFGSIIKKTLSSSASNLSWYIYLPPVAYLLFNLAQWENMFWGMAALQNFTVVVWVLGAIYLLSFTNQLYGAIMLGMLATLTSGNGLLIWPIGFGLLFLQARWKPIIYWSSSALVCIGLYFFSYEKPAGNPVSQSSITTLVNGLFAFNGAAGEALPLGSAFRVSLLFGGLMTLGTLVILALITRRYLRDKLLFSSLDQFFLGTALFLLGTAAIVVRSRAGFGIDLLITSRYKMYSLTLLAVLYVYSIGSTTGWLRKGAGALGLISSLVICGLSYTAYLDDTIWWRQWMLTNQFNWTYTKARPVSQIDSTTAHLIDNSPAFYEPILSNLYTPATGTIQPLVTLTHIGERINLADTSFVNKTNRDANTYLVLRSVKRLYLFQTTPNLNTSRRARLGLDHLFSKGFTAQLMENQLDTATYQLERLVIRADGSFERYPVGQSITARSQAHKDIQKNW